LRAEAILRARVISIKGKEHPMKLRAMLGVSLVALMAISAVSFAADPEKPAVKPDAKPDTKGVRLIKPYSDLKDLTADQTTKLKEIHKKFVDQIKALEAQQKDEMAAVLTDDQKKEVADAEKKPAKGKMKDDPAAPAAGAAAGQPKDPAKETK
jgi:Spy/CpxP family protein refolding chaperone